MEFNENKIMKELEIVKVNNWRNFPKTFTGIVETPNGDKFWYKDLSLAWGRVRQIQARFPQVNPYGWWLKPVKFPRQKPP